MKAMKAMFVLLGIAVLATSAMAASATFSKAVTAGKWYLTSIPGIPANPLAGGATAGIFGTTAQLVGNLKGFNTEFGSQTNLSGSSNILTTDGYWLKASTSRNIGFAGYDDLTTGNMDVWVSLPGGATIPGTGGGWALIGNPYNTDYLVKNLLVTDGNTTRTIAQAVNTNPKWVSINLNGFNPDLGSATNVSLVSTSAVIKPWEGYWIQTNVDNLALIFVK